jgi:hypothetical protein
MRFRDSSWTLQSLPFRHDSVHGLATSIEIAAPRCNCNCNCNCGQPPEEALPLENPHRVASGWRLCISVTRSKHPARELVVTPPRETSCPVAKSLRRGNLACLAEKKGPTDRNTDACRPPQNHHGLKPSPQTPPRSVRRAKHCPQSSATPYFSSLLSSSITVTSTSQAQQSLHISHGQKPASEVKTRRIIDRPIG